jgi:predicted cupin superfamily sugar epimerase
MIWTWDNPVECTALRELAGQLRHQQDGQLLFQAVVPASCWFASEPAEGSDFSLVGCTVATGFDFTDFELAQKDLLSEHFPHHRALINRLIR